MCLPLDPSETSLSSGQKQDSGNQLKGRVASRLGYGPQRFQWSRPKSSPDTVPSFESLRRAVGSQSGRFHLRSA